MFFMSMEQQGKVPKPFTEKNKKVNNKARKSFMESQEQCFKVKKSQGQTPPVLDRTCKEAEGFLQACPLICSLNTHMLMQ
jgi:hypothetical protein